MGYIFAAQLPTFERKFMVRVSSSTVEGQVTLVLSGKYTAYLPLHYTRPWIQDELIRPILPDRIGYSSLDEMIIRKESGRNALLNLLIDRLIALHSRVEGRDFRIDTDLPG